MMQAVYMPTSYSTSQGEVIIDSLGEVLSLLGIEESDLDRLVIPNNRGLMYLSRSAQREQETFNTTASFVLNEYMPMKVQLFGPVLFLREELALH